MTNVTRLAHIRAVPTTTPTGTPSDAIQLHAQASNALAMALCYLSQPDSNLAGASRKAAQAMAAIRQLSRATTTAASTQGGAA